MCCIRPIQALFHPPEFISNAVSNSTIMVAMGVIIECITPCPTTLPKKTQCPCGHLGEYLTIHEKKSYRMWPLHIIPIEDGAESKGIVICLLATC
jgi:hypothetical protein